MARDRRSDGVIYCLFVGLGLARLGLGSMFVSAVVVPLFLQHDCVYFYWIETDNSRWRSPKNKTDLDVYSNYYQQINRQPIFHLHDIIFYKFCVVNLVSGFDYVGL